MINTFGITNTQAANGQFQTISPIDGRVCYEGVLFDINQALGLANSLQSGGKRWAKTPLGKRMAVMEKFIDIFSQMEEEVGESITTQMGRPIKFSGAETSVVKERGDYMLSIAEEALADKSFSDKPGYNRFIRREPLGLAFIIAPWNYPYLTSLNGIIPALISGNSVLLKHSLQTPRCAELIAKALYEAGIPEDIFGFFQADHDTVGKLIGSGKVNFVSFTGSVNGGKQIERAAAGSFIPVNLELGGKDAAYVRADADIDLTAISLSEGAFFNSGQCCCGIERIYAHSSVYNSFVDALIEQANALTLDLPDKPNTTLGPMANIKGADMVRHHIAKALDEGATVNIDERRFPASQEKTPYVAPQVMTNVNHTMDIMKEETFGPVVGVMPVESDEEAVTMMNDSPYGLTASIWTKDKKIAEQLGNQIECGVFFMNRCDYVDPALPWCGVKDTGRGCSLSHLGYDLVTRPKGFHLRIK